MSDDLDRTKAEERLWDAIDDTRIGMLGLDEPGQHMQPMTAFVSALPSAPVPS